MDSQTLLSPDVTFKPKSAANRFDIYAVSLDGEVKYIGVTTIGVNARWLQHIYAASVTPPKTGMALAIQELGPDRFTIEHIASSFNKNAMLELELILIKQHGTDTTGYNRHPGRTALFERPLTIAERQARKRDKQAKHEAQKDDALDRILSAKTLREAHQIAREARGKASGRG